MQQPSEYADSPGRGKSILLTLLLLTLVAGGCRSGAPQQTGKVDPPSRLTDEQFTTVMLADQVVGFIGKREANIVRGESQVNTAVYNIYDAGFHCIGSFDASGSTYRFTRSGPEKVGHFSPEKSFQMVSGIEGMVQFREGLK